MRQWDVRTGIRSLVHLNNVTAIDHTKINSIQVVGSEDEHAAFQVHHRFQRLLCARRELVHFIKHEIVVLGVMRKRVDTVRCIDRAFNGRAAQPAAAAEHMHIRSVSLISRHLPCTL